MFDKESWREIIGDIFSLIVIWLFVGFSCHSYRLALNWSSKSCYKSQIFCKFVSYPQCFCWHSINQCIDKMIDWLIDWLDGIGQRSFEYCCHVTRHIANALFQSKVLGDTIELKKHLRKCTKQCWIVLKTLTFNASFKFKGWSFSKMQDLGDDLMFALNDRIICR